MNLLKKIPLPIAGVGLSMAALGNLIKDVNPSARAVLGIISAIITLLIIIKLLTLTKGCAEALKNPVVASAFATFPMSISILSTYITNANTAKTVWIISAILHVIYIIWFTGKFAVSFDIKKVFVPWFVVYVGIVACSVSSPAVGMQSIGKLFFWFGLIMFVILLPAIMYRVYKVKQIPAPANPTLAIFAAPASLLLAGYMSAFDAKNTAIVYILLFFSSALYILGLYYVITNITKKFYPSAAAYTFPMVISAIAMKMTNGYFAKVQQPIAILKSIATAQMYIAILVVILVFLQYIKYMTTPQHTE